jgi:hypothetical protein
MSEFSPIHFIDEPITVEFDLPPATEKNPPCPNRFLWQGQTYSIVASLSEWHDFTRRGKMARNMRPAHAEAAAGHGSLNVGRFFFRVRVASGQVFDLYYDRAMKDLDHRKGQWVVYREMAEINDETPGTAPSRTPPA